MGHALSLAIGSDGLPITTHHKWHPSQLDLIATHCLDALCSAATNRTIDDVGDVGSQSDIAARPNGHPIVAYYDSTNKALKIYACETAACNKVGNVGFIIDQGSVGKYPSIAIGVDDVAVVTYRDFGNGDLKIVFVP